MLLSAVLILVIILVFLLFCHKNFHYVSRLPCESHRQLTLEERKITSDWTISVIIPAHNEETMIDKLLATLIKGAIRKDLIEIIIVDAECSDNTISIASRTCSDLHFKLNIAKSSGGRGPALVAGSKIATGKLLLFLHADTHLPQGYDHSIRQAFEDPAVLMTCFKFGIDRSTCKRHLPWGLEFVERAVNHRTCHQLFPYGDQALCMTAKEYFSIGGFPCTPMMEDFEFVRKVKQIAISGNWTILQLDAVALCSPRRWEEKGVLRVSLLNFCFLFAYVFLRWTPEEIFKHYYRRGNS